MLGQEFEESDISDEISRCENIFESETADKWESMQRLFHRSAIKWLGGNKESGVSILNEIVDFIKNETKQEPDMTGDYGKDFGAVLEIYNSNKNIDKEYYNVIEDLLMNIRRLNE
jgi:hypothetical protein